MLSVLADVLVITDSSVGIATRYGLHGPGSEFRLGEIFRAVQTGTEPTQPPVQWVPGLPGGKAAGAMPPPPHSVPA